MSPKRSTRTLMAGALSLSLLAALLAVPASVLAGLPNWEIVSVEELPAAVSPGENAAYAVTIRNNGPSNISQLYVHANEAPNPVFAQPSQGNCTNPEGTLFCSLGSLGANRTATILAAFPTPDAGTFFQVEFFFNTTGLGSGGSDNSHGDELPATGLTTLTNDADFAGGFRLDVQPVGNAPISGASNKHSTQVFPPRANLPIVVADGDAVVGDPGCPAGLSCILETSQLQVGQGETFDDVFKVVISIDKTALQGISLKSIDVVHVLDDGETVVPITEPCPKRGTPTDECVTISSLKGGHGQVTLWLFENGFVKYH